MFNQTIQKLITWLELWSMVPEWGESSSDKDEEYSLMYFFPTTWKYENGFSQIDYAMVHNNPLHDTAMAVSMT